MNRKFDGIICPGFINTHCHLELSFLKKKISENIGMVGFIQDIVKKRNQFSVEQIRKEIEKQDAEMWHNGIVAVGDISNDDSTLQIKEKSSIRYHTFVEILHKNVRRNTA